MKKIMKDKRNVVLLVMGVICILTVIVGIAYAYISYYTRQSAVNIINTNNCIKVEMEELTDAINLEKAFPVSDEQGVNLKPYTFKLTNVCDLGVLYHVNLEVLGIQEGIEISNRLESQNIAVKVDDYEKQLLKNDIAITPTYDEEDYKATEAYTLYSGELGANQSVTHNIRLWLDQSAGNETQGKSFFSKVVIDVIQNEFAGQGTNFLDYLKTYANTTEDLIEDETNDKNLRFIGINPNNYVEYNGELWRIIGVMNNIKDSSGKSASRIKLIRAEEIGEYSWDNNNKNDWNTSALKTMLNEKYYNQLTGDCPTGADGATTSCDFSTFGLTEEAKNLISGIVWNVRGATYSEDNMLVSQIYTEEKDVSENENHSSLWVGKVGLATASDYIYATSGNAVNSREVCLNMHLRNWDQGGENACFLNDWLYMGKAQWTMTPYSTSKSAVFLFNGKIGGDAATSVRSIRPVVYLKTNVVYEGGSGHKNNPYKINKGPTEVIENDNFSEYIIAKSESDESIEKFVQAPTTQTESYATEEYRYTGASPNNYVYFGCSDNCTDDNLYRIIGVIPTKNEYGEYEERVKLIKAKYYNETSSGLLLATNASYPAGGGTGKGYQWNSSANNQWQSSTLQSNVLNGVFYSSLGEYQNYIAPAVWYLGAPNYNSYTTYTPDQFYNIERSNTKGYSGGIVYMTANIGLMYPSDYGYSIGSGYRGESVYNNAGKYVYNAWLYNLESKYYEWTMTPESSHSNVFAWFLNPAGYVYYNNVYYSLNVWGVRPVFFLKADVKYASGEGTSNNPYRISLS